LERDERKKETIQAALHDSMPACAKSNELALRAN
jgi:hypothetical protein